MIAGSNPVAASIKKLKEIDQMGITITPLNTQRTEALIKEVSNLTEFVTLKQELAKNHQLFETPEQESFEFTYFFPEQEEQLKKEALFLILGSEAIIEAVRQKCGNIRVLTHQTVNTESGEKVIRRSTMLDGNLEIESEFSYNPDYYKFIEHLKVPNPAQEIDGDEVKTQAWYHGCLIFGDPGTGKYYRYKWCGAKCGSGTPINALDRCCQAHDRCWAKFGHGDNGCDMELYHCASKTSDPGWYMVADFGYECAKNRLGSVC